MISLLTLTVAFGCATGNQPSVSWPADLRGVWEGKSTEWCNPMFTEVGRCNAVVNITLTMFQKGSKITGYYRCATGNTICRNNNDGGVISSGSVIDNHLLLRVSMSEDRSSCIYNGHITDSTVRGGYHCYQGGGLVDQGMWRAGRSY
jgi:hypothetical protein